MKPRESGSPKPPSPEEIQERVRRLRIRVRVLRDVMASYHIDSVSGKPATMLDCVETLQAEIWQRNHIIEIGKVTREGAARIEKEIGKIHEQKMILDDILPKNEPAKEVLTDMEAEIARLESTT